MELSMTAEVTSSERREAVERTLLAVKETALKPVRGPFARIVTMLGRVELGDLNDDDRDRILRGLFHEGHRFGRFARRFAALMTMSVLIAVMGLLADSTAVVIGAMLVAPLMNPVLGASAALVIGLPQQFLRQILVLTVGAAGAIGLAAATSLVFPGSMDPLPAEIVARTSPNLLDLGIALAAGAAGAYAQIRRAAADALTGVAVAVALVPPLAVVGITLEIGEYALSLGALMLFLANVAGIIMSAALTFLVSGVASHRRLPMRAGFVVGGLRWAALAVIVMVLPLHITRARVLPPTDPTEDIEHWLDSYLDDVDATSELVSVSVERLAAELSIDVVLTESGKVPGAEQLADLLASELQEAVLVSTQVVEVQTDAARADGQSKSDDTPNDEAAIDDGDG
ncbi:MAG: putative hydrophobic protein (TIGR00271 family) [Verrucomicrobiales bacterium]|jgi:uncharacterized hydrophobic protein (TIGR00271 family)